MIFESISHETVRACYHKIKKVLKQLEKKKRMFIEALTTTCSFRCFIFTSRAGFRLLLPSLLTTTH
ncbi:MAG TPA: hypothetical protein EYH00_00240 [Archaeoglobus profundus]|nr:hypothetical protein [Archaeoglobus profundus]